MRIFRGDGDYLAFIKLLKEAARRTGVRVLAFCLMPNHWHLILWPVRDGDLSRFMAWLTTTHVRRWREHRGNVGEGHLYQGRFKSFPAQDDAHLLIVLRYCEANALRGSLVRRAEDWKWSSLSARLHEQSDWLSEWPAGRPKNWLQTVNEPLPRKTVDALHTSVHRGRPFGSEAWQKSTAKNLGLESTLHHPWRPSKTQSAEKKSK